MKEKIVNLRKLEKSETGYIRRILAYAIDWYIGSVVASLPVILLYLNINKDATFIPQNLGIFVYPMNIIAGLLSILVAIIYYVIVPCFVWPGQTLGKKLLQLKIIDSTFMDASIKQICLRQAVMILLVEGSVYTNSGMIHQLLSIITKVNIVSIYSYIGLAITIFSTVLVLFLPSNQALHDVISKTKVTYIKTQQYTVQRTKLKKKMRKSLRLQKQSS